jgi:hypothetical protein
VGKTVDIGRIKSFVRWGSPSAQNDHGRVARSIIAIEKTIGQKTAQTEGIVVDQRGWCAIFERSKRAYGALLVATLAGRPE